MGLVVTNTLTRSKQEFVPRDEGKVAMYVCGPTVYGDIHVGNARAMIVFDVIRRYLLWRGFDVTFVRNYTDVDDKIIARAAEEGLSSDEVASKYSAAFDEVVTALGIDAPDHPVRATDHIPDMVEMIQSLIDRGFAYEAGGSVWFSVDEFPDYGKLSGRTLADMRAGERVEPDPNKRQPLDFAVWKAAKPGEPAWDSPWGPGRPGWHIECSAMSKRYLGMGFDIHGGGSDLVFPHHENEIAQAEAATGEKPFVRYWLHNGMVNMGTEKMSKSLGNLVLAKDLIAEVGPQVVRIMAIAGNYRSGVDFGEASLEQATRVSDRLDSFRRDTPGPGDLSEEGRQFLERFTQAMDDDFNTPVALGIMQEIIRRGNTLMADDGVDDAQLAGLVAALDQITSVLIGTVARPEPRGGPDLPTDEIDELIEQRNRARQEKDFARADAIRDRLKDMGVVIEDTPQGTRIV
ncbi:MAG: cysteine--tRNA ligase [Actinomycetota bacterium]